VKGIVLINLGTPVSPKVPDVRRYLHEFLTDGRVIDSPWLQRQLLVRGVIVPKRVKESARTYKEIWSESGSPLLVYGRKVQKLLQRKAGDEYKVVLGMRYQRPSIEDALREVQKCESITILPLFPQYASATTGSVIEEVMRIVGSWKFIPELRFINEFATHPGFIKAFAEQIKSYDFEHVLFSFHGLPVSQLPKDQFLCYKQQCIDGAAAMALEANLFSYSLSFQSRLGKEPWLEPFTIDTVECLAKQGIKKLLVVCPSFICDCLETLYEISYENREVFLEAGGEELTLCSSLNDSPLWIEALGDIVGLSTIPQHNRTHHTYVLP